MAEISSFEVPKWAGIPPPGYHLDVMKDGKLVQKLMIDEKNHYLFGRNMTMTDFCIDHASCSRVHAALVYHKNLERFFLMDLGSTHGSFIGNIRIEGHKLTQLPIDSQFHFGASTRIYVLREKPKKNEIGGEDDAKLSLPEYENEIDHLTEYNTAQNRRVSMLGVSETDEIKPATAKKRKSVQFKPDDEIINPEDIDPTVGRFRNLVQTTIIQPSGSATKRQKLDHSSSLYSSLFNNSSLSRLHSNISNRASASSTNFSSANLLTKSSALGIHLPNPAPEIDDDILENDEKDESSSSTTATDHHRKKPMSFSLYDHENLNQQQQEQEQEKDSRKKYAKEAWPGHEKTTLLTNF